ncbi:MAG: hypothetical protein E7297_09700 [Lachnospiraceae bacterium]|nr:hypothetical protein [Lachnospiraceae bacterium]
MGDYDRLIQLCDSMATAEGVAKMEERMLDVKRRYGSYPQDKWDANIGLRAYFEEKAGGKNIYELVVKDTFRP